MGDDILAGFASGALTIYNHSLSWKSSIVHPPYTQDIVAEDRSDGYSFLEPLEDFQALYSVYQ